MKSELFKLTDEEVLQLLTFLKNVKDIRKPIGSISCWIIIREIKITLAWVLEKDVWVLLVHDHLNSPEGVGNYIDIENMCFDEIDDNFVKYIEYLITKAMGDDL